MLKQRILYPFFLIMVLLGCRETEVIPDKSLTADDGIHLMLGNPINATVDVINTNNYLINRKQYTFSYSRERGTLNWVSWYVSNDWLGTTNRQDDFRADHSLPTVGIK
jgi:endonuclease G, mitochondrial